MERIVVCTVVTDKPAMFRKMLTSLRKNAGIHFEHYVVDNSQDPLVGNMLTESLVDGMVIHPIDTRVSFCIAMNLALDEIYKDPPDYVVFLDSDVMLHSRRVLKKMLRFAHEAREESDYICVQPKIERSIPHSYFAEGTGPSGDEFRVTFPIDPRCALVPAFALENFRFDHYAPMIVMDEGRLSIHLNRVLGLGLVELSTIRVKHLGETMKHRRTEILNKRSPLDEPSSPLHPHDQFRTYCSYGLGI